MEGSAFPWPSRILVILKKPTWITTLAASQTKTPPTMMSVRGLLPAHEGDDAEEPPPRASEPVSPMKKLGGIEEFHQKEGDAGADQGRRRPPLARPCPLTKLMRR